MMRGEPIRVGDTTLGRDYTHQDDTSAAICAVLDAPSLSHDLYNVSAGVYTTLDEVIRALKELRPSTQVVDDPSTGSAGARASSRSRESSGSTWSRGSSGVLDVSRLRDDVGFKPSFDITSGLKDYLQWREDFSYRD